MMVNLNVDLIFWTVISIVVAGYILERVLDYFNDKNWSNEVPEELQTYFDKEKLKRSLSYHKDNHRFEILSNTFSFVLMLLLLFTGFFGYLDEWVRGYTEHPLYMACLFFGILLLLTDILGLPFSCYRTFVLEEKYGFNKTRVNTFIADKVKGYIIGGVIGFLLLSVIMWLFQNYHDTFWIWVSLVMALFSFFMTMLYSSLILPLFNKLKPLEEEELKEKIENFSKKVGFQLNNIYVMDGSKRSSKANAFFSGFGPKKSIVLFDTLIEKHTTDELVAVLAHEIGHYKMKHTVKNLIFSVAQTTLMLYLFSLVVDSKNMAMALGASETSFHIGLVGFSLIYSPVSTVLSLLMNVYSRKHEFEADRFAKEHFDGESLKNALIKLSADHLANIHPHPAYVFVHYSHPPLLQRLKALKE